MDSRLRGNDSRVIEVPGSRTRRNAQFLVRLGAVPYWHNFSEPRRDQAILVDDTRKLERGHGINNPTEAPFLG